MLEYIALVVAIVLGLLAAIGGLICVWLGCMALLPTDWQLPATIVIALLALAGLLDVLDRKPVAPESQINAK